MANAALAVVAVPHFSERSRHSARARSLIVGTMTDLYSNTQIVKLFAAVDNEASGMRTVTENATETQQYGRRIHLTVGLPGAV